MAGRTPSHPSPTTPHDGVLATNSLVPEPHRWGGPNAADLGSRGPPSWVSPSPEKKSICHLTTINKVDPVAYKESSWPSSSYDGIYEVTQHMASAQQSEGDCLSKDHFSSLPDRVHLDLKQNDFTDLLNIWDKWGATTRANFDRKYGHIARLLKVDKFRKPFHPQTAPIREFCESEWPENRTKEQWISRLRELMSVEVTWRAPWMPHHPVLYKCRNEPWVPLMGPWGAISYAPIMVRRQFGSEQFVPMTHRLNTLEFAYGEPGFLKRIEEIAQAWKKTNRVDQGRYTDEVTTGYQMWHDQ
ncbi:Uncharacterized protein TCM_001059 [Theobroma cacao]|uniref:DUF7745 domain-containing protein n=1 Tax=Theobroma cacao TaxID=3641 RepID=A0A061DQ11_THECC|nr:Uncharacterized protein TCM_001059 [Theobroma cacao]